ncbi:DUF6663 family protein [Halorientalis salina]|jgi:hypothetical protein|uniref:DUF6663 family protein n=1 Tax=Halorientalis salina TaxID=2932266 RepID=UPI0010AC069E|nr:DUF6663 family protein [Halorientalis salina]
MAATESGTYRVFESDRGGEGEELLLVEKGDEEPIYVQRSGYYEPLQSTVQELEPGYLVDATLAWSGEGDPSFAELDIETRTLFEFVDGVPDIFEQAKETFEQGKREGMPIYSNVTYGTDSEANGVIYTFAKQGDEKDIFAEFKDGRMTLEPMIDKLGDGDEEPPFEVFVIRPESTQFLVVYLTLEKDGLLANTIRDEYDCPRPE